MLEETGWLVEGKENGIAVWLCISGGTVIWSADSHRAVRFCRKEDGESMISCVCRELPLNASGGLEVTEHIWSAES